LEVTIDQVTGKRPSGQEPASTLKGFRTLGSESTHGRYAGKASLGVYGALEADSGVVNVGDTVRATVTLGSYPSLYASAKETCRGGRVSDTMVHDEGPPPQKKPVTDVKDGGGLDAKQLQCQETSKEEVRVLTMAEVTWKH